MNEELSSIIVDKKIAIHCDTAVKIQYIIDNFHRGRYTFNYNPFNNYKEKTCMILTFNEDVCVKYGRKEYFITNSYSIIEFEDFINCDFYIIKDKVILMKEQM